MTSTVTLAKVIVSTRRVLLSGCGNARFGAHSVAWPNKCKGTGGWRRSCYGAALVGVLLALCTTVVAAQATAQDEAGRYYENAVKRYHQDDYDGAIIQLKNALQQDAQMLPAMTLMGEAYVGLGNGAAAETALREAMAAGADVSLTAVPLVKAQLLQFKHDEVLAARVPADLSPKLRAELLELKAGAALQVNDLPALRRLLEDIDTLAPEALASLSLRATIALRKGRFAEAEGYIERALQAHPENPVTWLTSASLAHTRGDSERALTEYAKVLELDPDNANARLARVGLLLDVGRDAETATDFLALADSGALDPRVAYLRAVKLARAGDRHGASSALNEASNLIDALGESVVLRNSQLLVLAGVVSYGLGNFEVARNHLERYVTNSGGGIETRKMLASIMLQQRDYLRASQVLEKLSEDALQTPSLLSMLAQAYTGLGEHDRAALVLEQAAALAPDDAALATKLALARARDGQIDTALAELGTIFSRDEEQQLVGMPLAILHMNRNDYASAADVARILNVQAPDDLNVMNLLAVALVGQGEFDEARGLLERALERDPSFEPADINLGKLERREGKFDAAEARFRRLSEARPDDSQLLLELARTAAARGATSQAFEWAQAAARAAPRSFEYARYLIELHLAAGDLDRAAALVHIQYRRHPDNLFVMETQARVLFAQALRDEAQPLLRRMVEQARTHTDWLLRVAGMQFDFALYEDARATLEQLVAINPADPVARGRLAEAALAVGDIEASAAVAEQLVRDFPARPEGHVRLGDVLVARGRSAAAAASFGRAQELTQNPAPDVALKRHLALRQAGEDQAAAALLRAWLERFPDDLWATGALGEHALHGGRLAEARGLFEAFLAAAPDHTPTLNNLANVLLQLGEIDAALEHARRAQGLAPAEPLFNDTLGWILVMADQTDEGLRYLREARARAAVMPEISYHLAVALHRQGRHDEALSELREALQHEAEFDGRSEALRLREELGG